MSVTELLIQFSESMFIIPVIFVILFLILSIRETKKMTNLANELTDKIQELVCRIKLKQSIEAIDQKKEHFLNIPTISFHYSNDDEIENFYNDYFKEPTIEQIISEKTSEVGGKVKGGVSKVLEAAIEEKDFDKWISTIKLPNISIAEKFRRYQRETIKNNQVTIGLDLVDIDSSDLNDFNKLVSELDNKFDFHVNDSQIEKQQKLLKEKAVEKTLVQLENATGWVLIEGKFRISNMPNNFYKCVYNHPVNEYLAKDEKDITISIILQKDSLKPHIAGNYAQSIGKSIPLKLYGKVWQPINREGDIWDLQITPLAVY